MSTQKKSPLIITLFILFGILLTACSGGAATDKSASTDPTLIPVVGNQGSFHAEGKVVPMQYTTLSFQASGEIGEISAKEGQIVKKGDVLAQLSKTEQLQAALSSAQRTVVDAQQSLDDLKEKAELDRGSALQAWRTAEKELLDAEVVLNDLDTKDYQDDLGDLEEDVQDEKEDLDDAQEDLDKYKSLDPSSEKRKDAQEDYDDQEQDYLDAVYERDQLINELDTAKGNVESLQAKVDDAKREYDNRVNGPDADELTLTQAALDEAKAQVDSAKRALANTEIVAPYDGVIVDLFHLTTGTTVNAGQSVVQMADFSGWYVETKDLTELDVVNVSEGETVELVADALPNKVITGTVDTIKQVFSEYSGDVVYTIRIKLTEPVEGLRWGMTVDVKFTEAEK